MKIRILFSFLLLPLLWSCNTKLTDSIQLVERLKSLEKEVTNQNQEIVSLAIKTRVSNSSPFKSPLNQFFDSDEFWEGPFDVSKSECYRRCLGLLKQYQDPCYDLSKEEERIECFENALLEIQSCYDNCRKLK